MASSLIRKCGCVLIASRSTMLRMAPARNAPRIVSRPNCSASATNEIRMSTAMRILISAVVSWRRTRTPARRIERPSRESPRAATTTRRPKPPRSTSLAPAPLSSPDKNRVSSTTAPKSATDELAMTSWPSGVSACLASLSTGTTNPSEVAISAMPTSRGACTTPPASSAAPVPTPSTTVSRNPEPARRSRWPRRRVASISSPARNSRKAGPQGVGAGYVTGAVRHRSDVEPLVTHLLLGQAHRAHLGVGERDAGNDPVVGDVGDVLAEDDVGTQAPLVLAHVGEQGPAVAVAHGVEPVAVGAPHAQLVVDVEESASRVGEADPVQPEVARARAAPDRDEDLVGGELAAVPQRGHDRAVGPVTPRRGHEGADDDRDALGFEGGAHLLARERLLVGEQPIEGLDDRDLLAAQPLERLRHLGADRAAAEHEQAPG